MQQSDLPRIRAFWRFDLYLSNIFVAGKVRNKSMPGEAKAEL